MPTFLTKEKRVGRAFGVLDVGTHKVSCAIVSLSTEGNPLIGGFAYRRSAGVRCGRVTDIDLAQAALRDVVDAAGRDFGAPIDTVFACSSFGCSRSRRFGASALVAGEVTERDVERTLSGARAYARRAGRQIVHFDSLDVRIDGVAGGVGSKLSADIHALTAAPTDFANLSAAIRRARLRLAGVVASSFAAAAGCTTKEERRAGVTCVDIGAGAVSAGTFRDGSFAASFMLSYGGNNIVQDIAETLQTSLAEARRIKALYGSPMAAGCVRPPSASDGQGAAAPQVRNARASQIIRWWVEKMAGDLRDGLPPDVLSGGLVVTGGLARVPGVAVRLGELLGGVARVGTPNCSPPLPAPARNPSFSTLAGALKIVLAGANGDAAPAPRGTGGAPGYAEQVRDWLRSSLK